MSGNLFLIREGVGNASALNIAKGTAPKSEHLSKDHRQNKTDLSYEVVVRQMPDGCPRKVLELHFVDLRILTFRSR